MTALHQAANASRRESKRITPDPPKPESTGVHGDLTSSTHSTQRGCAPLLSGSGPGVDLDAGLSHDPLELLEAGAGEPGGEHLDDVCAHRHAQPPRHHRQEPPTAS